MAFTPYSCFEIASIEDRALFKSEIDVIIIVEWNKDIEYFSTIIELLSRDLHCFCIQVNSSDYGDNRIVQPTSNFQKDIIRSKGGTNDYLIVDKINVEKLRNFQILPMEEQLRKSNGVAVNFFNQLLQASILEKYSVVDMIEPSFCLNFN